MKRFTTFFTMGCFFVTSLYGQLTIESCQTKARTNYPLIKQTGLIEQTAAYNIANANKGYLPQFSISAKATYQSEVTEIPIKLPNMSIESMSKDQYQVMAEVQQTLWDGGIIGSQKKTIQANTEMEKQKTEVDLYALNDRVNQLFFGILLLNEQLRQNDLLQQELKTMFDRVTAYMSGGIANQSDIDAVKVEQLKTKQRRAEIIATRKSFKEMLSAMIGEAITDETELTKPAIQSPSTDFSKRAEYGLFNAQTAFFDSQRQSISAGNMPKIGLFFQAGYGKPGLNMLKTDFSAFYIGGVRLSWNFGGFYSQKNNFGKIEINKQMTDVQKQTFEFNTKLKISQQSNDIEKYNQQIAADDEIITLRKSIKDAANVKLENGTISVSDMIREVNAENIAIQDKSLHEMQLLIAIFNLKNTTNN